MPRLCLPLSLLLCLWSAIPLWGQETACPGSEELDTSGQIHLHWQIDSAEDNYGFYLMRAEDADGPWVRVNEDLIPGVGTTSEIHRFDYVDENLVRGRRYWYRLHEVGTDGGETLMGTIDENCRTVEEDIIHERRKALGEEIEALGEDFTTPLILDEWVVFLHPRGGEPVHLIGSWLGWDSDPLALELLPETHWLATEVPLTELPASGERLAYLFVVGEGEGAQLLLDPLNPQQWVDPERGEWVSVFFLGVDP